MNIGIVNDLEIAVETLRRVVESVPRYKVAWIAKNGQEAVELTAKQKPDLILMDLIMPVMDGVESTRLIMAKNPCPIIVVTASVKGNSPKVFAAMGHGALDAVKTPKVTHDLSSLNVKQLLDKISDIEKISNNKYQAASTDSDIQEKDANKNIKTLVAIGASTGGPKAVATILSSIPKDFRYPIVLIQHVDESFSTGLANWLDIQCELDVSIAKAGTSPKPGNVYVAGKNEHLIIKPNLTFGYTEHPSDYPYRPSVDVFYNSVVKNWPGRVVGVLLTGMGRDGAEGLLNIRKSSNYTIVQDEKSSVVYGMPKAAVNLKAAEIILPIDDIANEIINNV